MGFQENGSFDKKGEICKHFFIIKFLYRELERYNSFVKKKPKF